MPTTKPYRSIRLRLRIEDIARDHERRRKLVVVMVGDSIEQDAIAPRQCGVFSIWFNENGRMQADENGVPMIHRLGELIALLGTAA